MNFGITHVPATNTINPNINNTVETTAVKASLCTKTDSDNASDDTKTIQVFNKSLNSSNQNISNSLNISESFTTPQNSFEVLKSIQNKSVSSNCESTVAAAVTTSTLILQLPSLLSSNATSSNAIASLEASHVLLPMKLIVPEDLIKETSSSIADNCSNIGNTFKLTVPSSTTNTTDTANILKSDNVTTGSDIRTNNKSLKELNEQNARSKVLDNIEFYSEVTDTSYSESNISINSTNILRSDEDSLSKSSENSGDVIRPYSPNGDKIKNITRLSERVKRKPWYNVLYPNYKTRSQDFKKLFKEVPNSERLIVDYSCALYRDLLIQGRLYISQNYVCFYANILGWETFLIIKWKDVVSITKEKTALVIPNAISICTLKEKFFFSSFTTRDKTFLLLFRVWQNTLMNKFMVAQEVWQLVHNYYGDELGLTTDDEDYIDPKNEDRDESASNIDFVSATDDSNSLSLYAEIVETINSNNSQVGDGASNNNSGNTSASSSCNKHPTTMNLNAKELKLISSKPDNSYVSNTQTQATNSNDCSDSVNIAVGANCADVTKESKHAPSVYDSKRKVSKNSRLQENINKNSETLPTDISDSSDSEEPNIPFVATAECNSPHEGRQLVHTILPINIDTLFNLLFSKSKFLLDFHARRKSTDLIFGEWIIDENGQKTRTFNVTVQLAASVGPKTSKVTEFQVMRDCSKPGELYSIDINNVNAGIPYADSFSVLVHYCLVKTVDNHTMLSVHGQIKYKKSIWGVVKGFIEKNTWAGLDDFYTSLLHSLQSETCIPPAKGKGRRPRRGTVAQMRSLEDLPILQAKPEPLEHCGVAQTVTTRNATDSHIVTLETTTKYRWLSLLVLVLLFFLIIVNVILLLKLWKLEQRIEENMSSRARMPFLSAIKQMPNDHEDWIELLCQQEILHETELKKWHTVLQTAIELLKKTERTLAELMFR